MAAYDSGTSGTLAQDDPRTVRITESALSHPTHSDGFADSGDPVVAGRFQGVNLTDAAASTDLTITDTMGVYYFDVVASDQYGTANVVFGDPIFIATGTGVLSKDSTGRLFGVAAGTLTGSASAASCPVRLASAGDPVIAIPVAPLAAADVAKTIFTAPFACKLIGAIERHGTVAGQAGTLTLEKCNTGKAATQGDVMLASAFDLTSTINTPVSIKAVADGKESMVAGDAIFLKVASGAATSLANMSITLLIQKL